MILAISVMTRPVITPITGATRSHSCKSRMYVAARSSRTRSRYFRKRGRSNKSRAAFGMALGGGSRSPARGLLLKSSRSRKGRGGQSLARARPQQGSQRLRQRRSGDLKLGNAVLHQTVQELFAARSNSYQNIALIGLRTFAPA